MALKHHRPETALVASVTGAGGKIGLQAAPIFTPLTAFDATPYAVQQLAFRFGFSLPTASAMAELAGFGRRAAA